jgi:hypothetical protein
MFRFSLEKRFSGTARSYIDSSLDLSRLIRLGTIIMAFIRRDSCKSSLRLLTKIFKRHGVIRRQSFRRL